ncbi:hypothetical protein QX204_14985 [Nocardia sp. PE-7]|uniref:hypothetical protein n=1 Tax=Nocardia sp. PE-7 TaxID=3058426 RepID=UPI00265B28D4|nr:hypothetical protein [Nocardia sp. PE-7]WKG12695.1 hypothetical protein QX204_14985 [Nocardia sp. PE-7]
MTTLESRILAALAPGGMLTITTIARNVKSTKWATIRAATALQRKDFAFKNRRDEWQVTIAGRKATTR